MRKPFSIFDEIRIINLADRGDRRREMSDQFKRLGGMPTNASFFAAQRPDGPGQFPSSGARGCFLSHLAVLRDARDRASDTLLILEDDLDFTRSGLARLESVVTQLSSRDWSIFYGAHVVNSRHREGLVEIAPEEPILTASFVGFKGRAISELVDFMEAMLLRPAGSPEFGPMHVDGAYTVFRRLNPGHVTYAAFPSLGRQRSSTSDITPGNSILDRWRSTKNIVAFLRRTNNWVQRHKP